MILPKYLDPVSFDIIHFCYNFLFIYLFFWLFGLDLEIIFLYLVTRKLSTMKPTKTHRYLISKIKKTIETKKVKWFSGNRPTRIQRT
jgi:hypothetical protein